MTALTALIVFHTAVSVLPIGFGLYAFARYGAIDPRTRIGQFYLATMLVGSVSAFGFIPAFGFTPGQVLTLITLGLLFAGTFTLRGHRRSPGVVQTLSLSASYLLLMVFATTETLKRVPFDRPFASSAADPSLLPIRLGLLVLFTIGVTYQLLQLRKARTLRLAAQSYAA